MDYVVLSTLKQGNAEDLERIVFSYDISCQWSRNFSKRIESYPERLKFDLSRYKTDYKIPKFHLPAHGKSCQTRYSFNFARGVGRTCGEGIEQGWAGQNPVSMSTKEMGPAARGETLDDHWGGWNFRKVTGLGMYALHFLARAPPDIYSRFVFTTPSGPRRQVRVESCKELRASVGFGSARASQGVASIVRGVLRRSGWCRGYICGGGHRCVSSRSSSPLALTEGSLQ